MILSLVFCFTLAFKICLILAYPPNIATGDQEGVTGNRAGARSLNVPAPYTILPPIIVRSDSMCLISSSGTVK